MYDPIAITALLISILTAVFVAIKGGIGLSLEYRESAETSKRIEAIDQRLSEQLGRELKEFLDYCSSKKEVKIRDEEVKERVIELGRRTRFLDLSKDILKEMTRYSKRFLRQVGGLAFTLFITIVLGAYFWEFDFVLSLSVIVIYGGTSLVMAYWAYSNLQKYYFARENFVALSENPVLDHCEEIIEEMLERGIL